MTRTLIALLGIVLVSVDAAEAAPPTCYKWSNGLTCQEVGTTCTTDAQVRYYNQQLYSDDPQTACEKAYQFHPNPPASIVALPTSDPDEFGCHLDGQSFASHVVVDTTLTPEDMCFRTLKPNTPYANLGTSGTYGAEFSTYRRNRILDSNIRNWGQLHSDFKYDPIQILVPGGLNLPQSANVDHIIPRVDIQGCECGPNSYQNAIVISRVLNQTMSNFSSNAQRQMILNLFTVP